jgi:glyoxylase-like metal-dependent hydrolase (beta-lactamase superfamily II)
VLTDFGSGKILDHLAGLGISTVDYILHTHHHRDQSIVGQSGKAIWNAICSGESNATALAQLNVGASEVQLEQCCQR